MDKSSAVENEKEQMTSLDTLAAYYVQLAHKEKVKEKRSFILLRYVAKLLMCYHVSRKYDCKKNWQFE